MTDLTATYSSDRQDWGTPPALFDWINAEFQFKLDAAASSHNAKCRKYLTIENNALETDWSNLVGGGAVWLNPPYGREIGKWIAKASLESKKGCTVVCLTFARTDTRWWHQWAMKAAEIRLIPGRIKFDGADSGAPAPSCLIVFDEGRRVPVFKVQDVPKTARR